MSRAECVVHINVCERGERFRKLVVIRLFPRIEPRVFQQYDTAVIHTGNHLLNGIAHRITGKAYTLLEKLTEVVRDCGKAQIRIRLSTRTTKVADEDGLSVVVENVPDGREGSPDACIVGNSGAPILARLEGYVEVNTDENPLSPHVHVVKSQFRHDGQKASRQNARCRADHDPM